MVSTTTCVFNSGLREGSVITTALDGMGRCGLWSRPQRGQGEGQGAEEQEKLPFTLRSGVMAGDGGPNVRVSLRSGTVLSRKVVGETAHSPVQSDSPLRPQRNRGYTETNNRQVKKAG